MSVKVIDLTPIVILKTNRSASLALRYLTDEIQAKADPNTPMGKGNLRRNVVKTVLGLKAQIKWAQHYASIQERKQFSNYTTSGTGPHYAENAVLSVANSPQTAFRKAKLI